MDLNNTGKLAKYDLVMNRLRHFIIVTASVILLTVGIIGILLPIIPGIPFLILGLMLWYHEDARQIRVRIGNWKNTFMSFVKKDKKDNN